MDWDREGTDGLDAWLAPFFTVMKRKTRRTWVPLYLRGLLGPGDRKSLQSMAARLGLSGHDQLQHFIATPAWDDRPLWTELARQADRQVGGSEACLVIDDTALPKKGTLSVGVARQYCGALGKQANCQSLVFLTLTQSEVPVPVGLHLFLPEAWTSDPQRCVPEAATVPRSKGEIALCELDRLRTAGLRFGTVLADAGYGVSAAFRHALDARGLRWAVGIVRNHKVYAADVRLVPPMDRARKPLPDQEPWDAEAMLADLPWRHVSWRQGTKGKLSARFAAVRVRVGDGPVWGKNLHLPSAEVWLAGEWRSSRERKYCLSNLPPETSRRALAGTIKARWVCEQAHQQLKEELGLDHFKGRSWTGLLRHALMTCIAYTYLQHLRLAEHHRTGRGKNEDPTSGATTVPKPARRAAGHHRTAVRQPRPARPMSPLPKALQAAL